ncbi:MAG: phosphoribosylamine--glycine ligase [Alphaproteobacteria bacterium]|nr:phosphoribosylamine--glycine ligase [Alphaproteobacteria bacterium]
MKVLVIGSGGREHALCWSFAQSPLCEKLFCAPGNPGIESVATCLPIQVLENEKIVAACREHEIDFVMIGPEIPLANGLADALRAADICCFGPSKAAAQLESSKGFMKDLCKKYNIPTAAYERFTDPQKAKDYVKAQGTPIVVKADGLAAGKGVTIAQTIEEANAAIDDAMIGGAFGEAGAEIVIEEFMTGEEASFFALCDGRDALYFASAQDHKAVYDGDKGPNTGGMGAYSPAAVIDDAMRDRVMKDIILPTVKGMKAEGCPFTGIFFAGLMITATGPRLIEYNCRFGDPETQAMLPRLKSDLLSALYATARGLLSGIELHWHDYAALCVVMAANGYPGAYEKGSVIGLDEANKVQDGIVFHAGTARNDKGEITANGGRVLGVTGWASTIVEAQAKAYQTVDKVNWPEGFCRRDIGWRAVARAKQ